MELPDKITFNVVDKSKQPIEGIIIEVKVYSGTKNPYIILSPKTNVFGKSEISKTDFIGQYEDHWQMGLMDYNGTIHDAKPKAEVYLFNPEWTINNKDSYLAWPLLKNEIPLWGSKEEKYNYLTSCSNHMYRINKHMVNFSEVSDVIVMASKKWF